MQVGEAEKKAAGRDDKWIFSFSFFSSLKLQCRSRVKTFVFGLRREQGLRKPVGTGNAGGWQYIRFIVRAYACGHEILCFCCDGLAKRILAECRRIDSLIDNTKLIVSHEYIEY